MGQRELVGMINEKLMQGAGLKRHYLQQWDMPG
jgi:hypothetical protein